MLHSIETEEGEQALELLHLLFRTRAVDDSVDNRITEMESREVNGQNIRNKS